MTIGRIDAFVNEICPLVIPIKCKEKRAFIATSCGYRHETVLVVQSAEGWRRDNAMTITNLMAA